MDIFRKKSKTPAPRPATATDHTKRMYDQTPAPGSRPASRSGYHGVHFQPQPLSSPSQYSLLRPPALGQAAQYTFPARSASRAADVRVHGTDSSIHPSDYDFEEVILAPRTGRGRTLSFTERQYRGQERRNQERRDLEQRYKQTGELTAWLAWKGKEIYDRVQSDKSGLPGAGPLNYVYGMLEHHNEMRVKELQPTYASHLKGEIFVYYFAYKEHKETNFVDDETLNRARINAWNALEDVDKRLIVAYAQDHPEEMEGSVEWKSPKLARLYNVNPRQPWKNPRPRAEAGYLTDPSSMRIGDSSRPASAAGLPRPSSRQSRSATPLARSYSTRPPESGLVVGDHQALTDMQEKVNKINANLHKINNHEARKLRDAIPPRKDFFNAKTCEKAIWQLEELKKLSEDMSNTREKSTDIKKGLEKMNIRIKYPKESQRQYDDFLIKKHKLAENLSDLSEAFDEFCKETLDKIKEMTLDKIKRGMAIVDPSDQSDFIRNKLTEYLQTLQGLENTFRTLQLTNLLEQSVTDSFANVSISHHQGAPRYPHGYVSQRAPSAQPGIAGSYFRAPSTVPQRPNTVKPPNHRSQTPSISSSYPWDS